MFMAVLDACFLAGCKKTNLEKVAMATNTDALPATERVKSYKITKKGCLHSKTG